jgi:uncharacterized damage-inducible protein DinB
MITVELVRDLFAHMEWADARIWAAVPTGDPPDEDLRRTLVHIHIVQLAFLEAWTGRFPGDSSRKAEEFASLADVRAWVAPYYGRARDYISTIGTEQLASPLAMPWAAQLAPMLGHEPATTTLGETCVQVASHTTHHRGQVNTRLRAIGVEPPYVDYIAWIWHGRPAPAWR